MDRSRRATFVALCLLLAAGFAALGVWQVERRAWKLDLIARVDARIHAAPAALPPRSAWGGDLAYRRVRVSGTFDNDRETLVQALTARGAGWWVVTPLRTPVATVLVNRGFVTDDRRERHSRLRGATVTGLLRITEPDGGFLRRNDPSANRWYSRDVVAIARARRLGAVAPFFIDADASANPGGYPIGGLTVVSFPNNHLVYAVTWFALAGMSLAGAAILLRSR